MDFSRLRRWVGFILVLSLSLWQGSVFGIVGSDPEEPSQGQQPLVLELQPDRPPADNSQKATPDYVPGQIIVKLKEGYELSAIEPLNRQYGVKEVKELFPKQPSAQERLEEFKKKREGLGTKEGIVPLFLNRWIV